MLRLALPALTIPALTALALAGRGYAARPPSAALAAGPALSVQDCVEADVGDTFTVSIAIAGVTNLLAWDIYYGYDRKVVEVVDRNVRQFLDKEPNSNVFDFSDPLPNSNGLYHMGAADVGGQGTMETGSGVLTTVTLRARSKGVSWSSLVSIDKDSDGSVDLGPTLTEAGGAHPGDADGDGLFDGPVSGGQIAVGRSCNEPAPTPFVPPDVIPGAGLITPAPGTPAPTPTLRPDGSTPEPEATSPPGQPPSGSPVVTVVPPGSPAATAPPGQGGGGSSSGGGGPSPLLATLIGAGGGAGILACYFILRAVRRPA